MRIELSNGGWAELRDPATLTNGQRKPFLQMFSMLPTGKRGEPDIENLDMTAVLDMSDTLLRVFIESWSFGPLPAEDPEALDNLLSTDYDTLAVAAGELMGELVPKTPERGSDPTEPSTPSSGS